jgi:mRNA-degrading endonuclease toxin of MazEF toxin-antitoxin module
MQLFAALGKGSGESDRVVTLEVQLEQERSERKVLMDKIRTVPKSSSKNHRKTKLIPISHIYRRNARMSTDGTRLLTKSPI